MDYDQREEQYQKRRGTFLTILFASIGGFGVLVFLIMITWGLFLYVVLAVGGLAGIIFINYLLWGRGMMAATAGEREEEELRASMERQPWELSEPEQPRHL